MYGHHTFDVDKIIRFVGKMWKTKENLNFGVDIYALSIYNSCINESHVCVYVHVRARI